ncbi:MAG TPA: hypothetical protein VFH26_04115 [Gemmatimonadales bacterium]|nr:hypothetical protein [Gemmatimonadales bacterium]
MSANSHDSLPESGMGGASDAGAHGNHPASAARLDERSARPENAPGDAAVERRHETDPHYDGPERRMGRKGGSRAQS